MRKRAGFIISCVALVLSHPQWITAQSNESVEGPSSAEVHNRPVRSEDPTVTRLIFRASEGSAMFHQMLDEVDANKGIVYVERGRCRHGGPACMAMTVTLAGPYRILRIVVDPRQADCDRALMASIGHELWHAIEVLREPSLTSYDAIFHFYYRDGRRKEHAVSGGGFETPAAINAGHTVLRQLRDQMPDRHRC